MSRLGLLLLLIGGAVSVQGWEDQFAGKTLDARWQWRVPVKGPTVSLSDRPGWLRVQVPDRPTGFNHWNEPKPVDEAAQLRTPAPAGDWVLEARIHLQEFSPDSNFFVGLIAGGSDDLLLSLGPLHAAGMTAPEVWFEPTGTSGLFRVPGEARDVYLRLVRKGNLCRGQVSRDGKTWVEAGCYITPQKPTFLGLIGKTFAAGPTVAFDVDYIRVTSLPTVPPDGPRTLVGIGGDYPTGYRGLLARLGLPHEVVLDYQLADPKVLGRFDLLLIGSLSRGIESRAQKALMNYVKAGGTALLGAKAFPLATVVPGKGARAKNMPDILFSGAHNPLLPWLGKQTRFAAGETRFHFAPTSTAGLQILAYYDTKPANKGKKKGTVVPAGTPAIWAMPLGKGLLVYSAPSIGASLSWGPTHDQLAEALIQCLAGGRAQPQLVAEGARFGRKQSGRTEASTPAKAAESRAPGPKRLTLTTPRDPLPPELRRIRSKTAPEFNLTGAYRPGRGVGQVLLNRWNSQNLIRVVFDGVSASLSRVEDGKVVDTAKMRYDGAAEIPFVLKERYDHIALQVGPHEAKIQANGLWEGALGASAKALGRFRYQQLGAAFLSDDFMRGEKEQGAWKVIGGTWSIRSTGDPKMGANPFTYRGKCAPGTGWAVAGFSFWDDYSFSISAKPTSKTGAVALAFHFRDEKNHLLFRLRVSDSPAKGKKGAELVRVSDGKETVLAQGDGCLVKGQWYRLSVQSEGEIATASIDGKELLRAKDNVLRAGKVALAVRDGEAEFDDAAVRPISETTGPELAELDGAVPRFAGTMDRDTWAGAALQWRAAPSTPGLFWRRGAFSGDIDLTLTCNFGNTPAAAAALTLLLVPAEGPADGGHGLILRPSATTASATRRNYEVEFTRQGTSVARAAVVSGPDPVLSLRRVGSELAAWIDGRQVLACPPSGDLGACSQLGFQATGFLPRISGLRLHAGNVLDYYFDHAPTDWWIGSGTWELAVRWPCTPEWSWLAGESRSVAALWHKRQFTGDHTLDLHVGPRTVDHGDKRPREICRAFNVLLCGDGQDVKSGYSFVVGGGKTGTGATLSRNGKVVASEPAYRIYSDAHNQWINVRAEKVGATIRLWVGDQRVLSWQDPNPLPGGRLAVWTQDNAVMIPRVTIYHAGS
jgi:hypothetical protein